MTENPVPYIAVTLEEEHARNTNKKLKEIKPNETKIKLQEYSEVKKIKSGMFPTPLNVNYWKPASLNQSYKRTFSFVNRQYA